MSFWLFGWMLSLGFSKPKASLSLSQNRLRFPGLCTGYCLEFFNNCNELVPKLTNDTELIESRDAQEFCDKIKLSDKDYCFPELLVNPIFTGELARSQSSEDGCLCVEPLADNLRNPTFGTFSKDSSQRFYVLEQKGLIWIYTLPDWTKQDRPFLDIQVH